jgi:hypothetical protein
MRKLKYYAAPALLVILIISIFSTMNVVALSGAIYTSNYDATVTNENHYDDPFQAYLTGGPGTGGSNLKDDYYYFQVTDSSGKTILSSDDITNREFQVIDGWVAAYDGTHETGVGTEAPGQITVQLWPFDESPNGVYKLWATPVTDYETYGDFRNNYCKTDNFHIDTYAVEDLTVSKTVETSYTRTHYWSITKTVNDKETEFFHLINDGSDPVTATWKIEVTYDGYEDSEISVSGEITIENTGTMNAYITSISDVLPDDTVCTVTCYVDDEDDGIDVGDEVDLPYTLNIGDTMICEYGGYVHYSRRQ